MAQELYTRTNQKLYFAGLALENWRKAEEQRAINAQALMQAEREAALFHLYGSLLGLCHEIAGYYRLPQANASRAEALLLATNLDDAPSPELAELIELAQHSQTWLAQLLSAYNELFEPLNAPKKAKIAPNVALIEMVNLDQGEPPLGHAELEDWRQQLKLLAQRFREAMVEW